MSKEKSFERELPEKYAKAKYINAKDVKLGIIFNLIALVVLAAVIVVAAIPLYIGNVDVLDLDIVPTLIALAVFMLAMIAYIVLHEIVHGIAYKKLTGEKLTFGMSWSCAYCGVPNIYTYRRTALIALVSPLIVFTLILIPLTVALYFTEPLYYMLSAFILGLHLGGCSGDIYCTLLFLFKFKDNRVLMRDTGPEQYFYVPEEN